MVMSLPARGYTVAEVLEFPADGRRYELVAGGLLVTPAPEPRHQELLRRLVVRLSLYLEAQPEPFRLVASPADVSWDAQTLVQPDLFVVPSAQATNDWRTYRDLRLAVEIVSPGSRRMDRVEKRRLYQARGVEQYWVVDPDARLLEVWRPRDDRPDLVTEELCWRVSPAAAEFRLVVESLFEGMPG